MSVLSFTCCFCHPVLFTFILSSTVRCCSVFWPPNCNQHHISSVQFINWQTQVHRENDSCVCVCDTITYRYTVLTYKWRLRKQNARIPLAGRDSPIQTVVPRETRSGVPTLSQRPSPCRPVCDRSVVNQSQTAVRHRTYTWNTRASYHDSNPALPYDTLSSL